MNQLCFTSQKMKRNMPTVFKDIKGCWEGGCNLLFVYMVGGARSNGLKVHKEIPSEVSFSPSCLWWYSTINTLSYIKCSCKWSLLSDKCEKSRKLIKNTHPKHSTPPLKQQHENLLGNWNYVVWELWKVVFWAGRWMYLWEKSGDLNRFREAKNQDCPEMNSQEEGEAFWVEIQLRDLEKWWSDCWFALLFSHRKNFLLHLRREINKKNLVLPLLYKI